MLLDIAIILVPLLLAYVSCEFYWLIKFRDKMEASGYAVPPLGIGYSWRCVVAPFKARREYRNAARVWYAEREHISIILFAISITLSGVCVAFRSALCTDFGRSGALIVIVGFLSVFIGLRHGGAIFKGLSVVFGEDGVPPIRLLQDVDRAQRLSSLVVFLVTAYGTFIWGYGDLLLARLTNACR